MHEGWLAVVVVWFPLVWHVGPLKAVWPVVSAGLTWNGRSSTIPWRQYYYYYVLPWIYASDSTHLCPTCIYLRAWEIKRTVDDDYYAVTMHAAGYVTTKPRHNVRFLIRPLKKQISTRRDNALVRERNVQVALHCVICPETSFHALWIVICTYVHAWIDVHVLVWFLPGRWPIISGQPLLLMLSIGHRSISRPVSFCHYS